nr:hypothetical protein Iba_chr07aCG4480 [Ipomoea batatas]
MLRAPGGRPTSLHTSSNSKHVLEASSDGLCIAAQPAASAVEEGVVFGFVHHLQLKATTQRPIARPRRHPKV